MNRRQKPGSITYDERVDLLAHVETTPEEKADAASYVRRNATDPDEVLEMLGLA